MIIQPPSSILCGPSGSGKTAAISTQLLCGLRVFVIMTEPDGVASLLDNAERIKAPIDKLHWTYCPPQGAGWMELEDMYTKVNSMDQKGLADMRDLGKSAFKQSGLKFLNAFRNFHCERTNQDFGDFTRWDDTNVLNVDSLSGWSLLAWGLTVGYKPTANPGEWGIAQNVIYNHLVKINTDRRCFFNLTSHVEREIDDMTGAKRVTVSTIGAKLAPKITPFFSEVIRTHRDVDSKGNASFRWSTYDSQMDLKNRALPMSERLQPDFRLIVDAYRRRLTQAGQPTTSVDSELAGGVSSPPPSAQPGAGAPGLGNATTQVQSAPMTPSKATPTPGAPAPSRSTY